MTPAIRHEVYSRARLLRLLDALDQVPPGPLQLTLGLLPGATVPAGATEHPRWPDLDPYVARSEIGAYVFLEADQGTAVIPPFPPAEAFLAGRLDIRPLRALLASRPCVGVVLVRLGGYAIGVYEGDRLVASKNDSRFVKNRHRKGGQSQRRFERIREKQIDELFKDVCEAAQKQLAPFVLPVATPIPSASSPSTTLDWLVYGGDRNTVRESCAACRWLRQLPVPVLPRFLTVPEPRHQTLVDLPFTLWSSRVIMTGSAAC